MIKTAARPDPWAEAIFPASFHHTPFGQKHPLRKFKEPGNKEALLPSQADLQVILPVRVHEILLDA